MNFSRYSCSCYQIGFDDFCQNFGIKCQIFGTIENWSGSDFCQSKFHFIIHAFLVVATRLDFYAIGQILTENAKIAIKSWNHLVAISIIFAWFCTPLHTFSNIIVSSLLCINKMCCVLIFQFWWEYPTGKKCWVCIFKIEFLY